MLEILGTIFGSIFSGGATGIIGIIAQRFADYKNKQLDMQLESQRQQNAIALKQADAAIMREEWAAKVEVAQVESEAKKDVAASEAFSKSFDMEPKQYTSGELTSRQRWLMVFLDFIRGSVRPLLTVYLCGLTTLVYWQAHKVLATQGVTTSDAIEITKTIVGSILYLTTTCVLWWFGTRNRSPQK
jgi:hypothetical protein